VNAKLTGSIIAVFRGFVFHAMPADAQPPRPQPADINSYELGPDSKPQPGVPAACAWIVMGALTWPLAWGSRSSTATAGLAESCRCLREKPPVCVSGARHLTPSSSQAAEDCIITK